MKKLIFVLIAFALTHTACNNKCCFLPKVPTYIKAQKDSVQWEANSSTSTISNDTITIIGKTENPGALQETLEIKIKNKGSGVYNLLSNETFYYTTAGLSTPVFRRGLDSLFANSVNVFFYDPASGTMAGSFNLKFMYPAMPSGTTRDIAFLNGSFNLVLRK
jgi:hypothetical protein